MKAVDTHGAGHGLRQALAAVDASTRLRAALTAGTHPAPAYVEVLLDRCAVEPDFYVREMLTWALVRHGAEAVVDRVVLHLTSPVPQARSQALHTLSKLGDARGWNAITTEMLADDDEEVARTAWRAAAALVPEDEKPRLAASLATQFARGDRDLWRSLTRAFVSLGGPATEAVDRAAASPSERVRVHAVATALLLENPENSFDSALFDAERVVAREATADPSA